MKDVLTVASPAIGPAVVTVFGNDLPVLALAVSLASLLLARALAPPPLRKLNRRQEVALTALLCVILFLIVSGLFPGFDQPLGAGMATVWGVGLGFSGLLAVEFFGDRAIQVLRAIFNMPVAHGPTPPPPINAMFTPPEDPPAGE